MAKMLDWCLEKGKTQGRKHRGLRIIEPDRERAKEHIEKAVHNLNFTKEVTKLGKYDDWVFPTAFYAMYHACLAVLYYFGYESRNQECTFAAMEKLISEKKIDLDESYIASLKSIGKAMEPAGIKDLREEFQYGTRVKAEKEIIKTTVELAERFVLKVKGNLMALLGEI